jgi:hypothetical protein
MTQSPGSPGQGQWKVETVVMVMGFLFTGFGTVISYQVLQQNVFESNRQLYERLTRVEAMMEVKCGKVLDNKEEH